MDDLRPFGFATCLVFTTVGVHSYFRKKIRDLDVKTSICCILWPCVARFKGEFQRGITPFMFISPSDTKILSYMPNSIFNLPDVDGSETHPDVFKPSLSAAPSGYGQQYDDMFAANPYRNLEYKQSFWQRVASALGFRTGADKFAEQAQINANEYDADVFALMQANEYNSPTEQAERMRAAGLNPDLLGTGDVAPSAQMRNDANGMPTDESNEPLDVLNFASSVSQGVLNLIPQVLGFATNLQQLKGIRVDNDLKELSFGQNALQAAEDFFLNSITESEYRDAFEKNDWTNILDASNKNAKYLADTFLSSPKARKSFNLAYGLHANSLQSKIAKYKSYDEFEAARHGLLSKRASSFFADDDETMEGLIKSILGPTEQFQKRLAEINLRVAELRKPELEQGLENTQLANQLEYENAINPSLQAESENAVNAAVKQQNEIMEATNELFSSIMENLKSSDNWWSKIAMALVGIARAQLLSGMSLQFGRNSQYKVDGNTGVMTEQGSSNIGVSF